MSRDCRLKNKVQRQIATVEQKECNIILTKDETHEEVQRLRGVLKKIKEEKDELLNKIDELRN